MTKRLKGGVLPLIIMIAPTGGVLPNGFPLKGITHHNNNDVLKQMAAIDKKRLDRFHDKSDTPPAELWFLDTNQLRFLRELMKYIDEVQVKVVTDIPECEYSGPWMMLVSDLPTYSVDQLGPADNMENPNEMPESGLSEEAQLDRFQNSLDEMSKHLSDAGDDAVSGLGSEGVDDSPE